MKRIQLLAALCVLAAYATAAKPELNYVVSMPEPANHRFRTEFNIEGLSQDTVLLRMPKWTPGYYQLLDYASDVLNLSVQDANGESLPFTKADGNSWKVVSHKASFKVSYEIMAAQRFVARSFLDHTHAYIVPANTFLYIDGYLDQPVSVEIKPNPLWNDAATGLETLSKNNFRAANYDLLYDCPILLGNLEELPSFQIQGIPHRFVGYEMGNFDGALMMRNLKKFIEAAAKMFGELPYKEYTFIGIGQGRGGIEHLNNTTVSFNGDRLKSEAAINDMILYLGHEYFHNFNVKRIRPFELGPFDYNRPNRTNQLWISEGLTMYYEYVLAKRAGLMDEKTYLSCFEGHINSVQKNPARLVQSMVQSSYGTWEDGPFTKPGQTISYYEKGPLNGLILDLAIRRATQNKKSLDDVMRLLYDVYYKKFQRGFTDAEFQQACEQVAGILLTNEFEYVTTTKEMEFTAYLKHIGLELVDNNLRRLPSLEPEQIAALKGWLSE